MASTNVNIATIDRLVEYTPLIPPSFLPPICVKLADTTKTELDNVEVSTKEAERPDIHVCFLGGS